MNEPNVINFDDEFDQWLQARMNVLTVICSNDCFHIPFVVDVSQRQGTEHEIVLPRRLEVMSEVQLSALLEHISVLTN